MKGQRGRRDKFRKIVTLHSRWICYNLCALESCLKGPRKNERSKEMLDNTNILEGQRSTKSIYDKQHAENQGSL